MAGCHLGDINELCVAADAYLRPLFEAADQTALADWVKASTLIVPFAGALHLIALALLGGAVFLADLRALGGGVRTVSAAETIRQVRWIFRAGLLLAVLSGTTMAAGEIMKLYYSPPFWLKTLALLAALVFTLGARNVSYRSTSLAPSAVMCGTLCGISAVAIWGLGVGIFAGPVAYTALGTLILTLAIGAAAGARSTTVRHSIAACISSVLWLTVAASGRWIAFY